MKKKGRPGVDCRLMYHSDLLEMEVDFGAHVIRVARNCGNRYRCLYCDEIFPTEDEMVQHLCSPELDGGHVTGMLITYDNLNRFLNVARPPTTSYNVEESIGLAISGEVEESIGRAISEEVAINSEGEGDDPLCISSAEKCKAIDMELMCPTCKRSRYHKNVVEESTAVAYDMKEHVPIAEEEEDDVPKVPEPSKGLLEEHVPMKEKKDVQNMLRKEEELDEYAFNMQRKEDELEKYEFNMQREEKLEKYAAFSMQRKGEVRAMEQTWPTGPSSKRSRYFKKMVGESTELPESQRAEAVRSMVYEANARIRDPVYGCAGVVCNLQKQVNKLQAQLAKAQAEVVTMQGHQANLLALFCSEMTKPQEPSMQIFEDGNLGSTNWEPLWT